MCDNDAVSDFFLLFLIAFSFRSLLFCCFLFYSQDKLAKSKRKHESLIRSHESLKAEHELLKEELIRTKEELARTQSAKSTLNVELEDVKQQVT